MAGTPFIPVDEHVLLRSWMRAEGAATEQRAYIISEQRAYVIDGVMPGSTRAYVIGGVMLRSRGLRVCGVGACVQLCAAVRASLALARPHG